MIPPGQTAQWSMFAAIYRGMSGDTYLRYPDETLVSYVQRRGLGELGVFRREGTPLVSDFGFSPATTLWDDWDKYNNPASASEVLRPYDAQRCIVVDPGAIVPSGVAYELAHHPIPTGAVGILERVPTIFEEIAALDANGDPIFSFSQINGERPCLTSLRHPDPAAGTLSWSWRLTVTTLSSSDGPLLPMLYVGPTVPLAIEGDDLIPGWTDLRYGIASRWGDRHQIVIPARAQVRLWVVLRGQANRWHVRVGGRVAGYWQSGGRRGAALVASTHRIV